MVNSFLMITVILLLPSSFSFAEELSPVWLHQVGYDALQPEKPSFENLIGTWEKVGVGNRWDASYGKALCEGRKFIRFVAASTGNHLEVSNCDRTAKSVVRNISVISDDIPFSKDRPNKIDQQTFGFRGTFETRYRDKKDQIYTKMETGALSYNWNQAVTLHSCKFYPPLFFACVTYVGDTLFEDNYAIYVSRKEIDKGNPLALALKNAEYLSTDELNERRRGR